MTDVVISCYHFCSLLLSFPLSVAGGQHYLHTKTCVFASPGRVAEEHFGGFLTHKVETDKMNWKERMAELISQSKKQKVCTML